MKDIVRVDKDKSFIMYVFPVVIFIIGLLFLYNYYTLSKGRYIYYNEESNVNYNVCLKQNEFYENKCLEKNNQYVASLIDYIPANFNYKLNFLNSDLEYTYSYRMVATFNVKDSSSEKILFTKDDILYTSPEKKATNGVAIDYNLSIDYNKYNDLLNNFINIYDLSQTTNELKVSMDVFINGQGDEKFGDINTSKATSLTIPLTTKTVNIDINGTSMNSNDNRIHVQPTKSYTPLLILGVVFVVIALGLLILILDLIKKNRTVQEIYDNRIKKITLAYDAYIQKITGDYPIGASQICKVSSFQDMLEIKESSEKPLLMLENKEKTGTFFLIPVGEGVIYTYAIRVVDIESEIKGTKAPEYDVEDIKENKPEKKTYTIDKIKEDIKNTTEIEILDDCNAILGTKNSDEDLYEQLGKTSEYRFRK